MPKGMEGRSDSDNDESDKDRIEEERRTSSEVTEDSDNNNHPATVAQKYLNEMQAKDHRRHKRHKIIKRATLHKIFIIIAVFAAVFAATRIIIPLFLDGDKNYVLYFYLIETAVVGFILTQTLSDLAFKLLIDSSKSQAASSHSIVTIAGYLTTIIIIVASLAQNPAVTVAISTITGIVLGISAQSLIGNAIAGMVLAVSRPFRIGDTVSAFGSTGIVGDIGLLYTRIITVEGNTLMVPNTTLLTTAILKMKTSIPEDRSTEAA
jgi:small-conductance mechanosensitive channel